MSCRRSARLLQQVLQSLLLVSLLGGLHASAILPVRGQVASPSVRVAFIWHGNVWLIDGSTGRRMRLTSDGHDSGPLWTARGRILTFQRRIGNRVETLCWTAGRGITRQRDGVWSPDATARAFTQTASGASAPSSVLVTQHGRTTRVTPLQPHFRWYPAAWSPDGEHLALTRYAIPASTRPGQPVPPSPASPWVVTPGAGRQSPRRLPLPALSPGGAGWPDVVLWSPNGRSLTVGIGPDFPCLSCRADGLPFSEIPVAGGKTVSLGSALGVDGSISLSPDGSYLVLSSPAGRETYANKHLVRVDPRSGARQALTHDPRWADVQPAVSPDGREIAFVRGPAQKPSGHPAPLVAIAGRHVWVMDANGARPRQLGAARGWTDEAPVWSPDGRWILFVRWHRSIHAEGAAAELWAERADGRVPQRLTSLALPSGFLNGFGYYGSLGWHGLFAVAP